MPWPKGRPHSAETRRRISESDHLSGTRGDQIRRRMSEAAKRRDRHGLDEVMRKRAMEPVRHHINFDHSDDRPENVYVFSNASEHQLFHLLVRRLGIEDHFRDWFSLEEC